MDGQETPTDVQPAAVDEAEAVVSGERPTELPQREVDLWGHGTILMERCIADAKRNTTRQWRDRQDILNLRFDRGGRDNQWCVWDRGTDRFVPRGEDPEMGGLPPFVPRPVLPYFHTWTKGLTSILDQSEPAQSFAPMTDEDDDKATAGVAEDAVPVLREECGYDAFLRHELNKMVTLMSGAALIVYYDDDPKYGMKDVDLFRCPQCQQVAHPRDIDEAEGCPTEGCGNTDTESFELVTDPRTGLPIGVPTPVGKMCAETITSLEFSLPSSARRMSAEAVPWVLTHNRIDPKDIARWWPRAKPLVTDPKTGANPISHGYADEMRRLASPITSGEILGSSMATDGPVVYRVWHDPVEDDEVYLPNGFYGVMIDGQLVDASEMPFKDAGGTPFKNVLLRTWDAGVATAFGHPPADDLVPVQQSINVTQAMIELIHLNDGAPRTYVPDTVTFLDQPSGAPGEITRYRSIDGQKPTETHGMNAPSGLYSYLQEHINRGQQICGLNSVLVGERPKGDPTLGEVQLLEERGMATFRAPLDSLIHFEKSLSFLLLSVARQSAWSSRFRRLRGENGQWELKAFSAADLGGQVDIVVDRASAWPRSPLMESMKIQQAIRSGILPPPASDPELQGKLLAKMGLAHLKPSYDADRRQIARELDRWKAATSPSQILPPNPQTQNLQVHLYLKKEFLKTEDAERLATFNPAVYQAMLGHIGMIQTLLAPPPIPAPAAPPPAPTTPSGKARGSKGALDEAIASGQLVPEGAPSAAPAPMNGSFAAAPGSPTGAGNVLSTLVSSGQLVPGAAAAGVGGVPAPSGPSSDQLAEDEMRQPLPPPDVAGG